MSNIIKPIESQIHDLTKPIFAERNKTVHEIPDKFTIKPITTTGNYDKTTAKPPYYHTVPQPGNYENPGYVNRKAPSSVYDNENQPPLQNTTPRPSYETATQNNYHEQATYQ